MQDSQESCRGDNPDKFDGPTLPKAPHTTGLFPAQPVQPPQEKNPTPPRSPRLDREGLSPAPAQGQPGFSPAPTNGRMQDAPSMKTIKPPWGFMSAFPPNSRQWQQGCTPIAGEFGFDEAAAMANQRGYCFQDLLIMLSQEYERETTQLRGEVAYLQKHMGTSAATHAASVMTDGSLRQSTLVEQQLIKVQAAAAAREQGLNPAKGTNKLVSCDPDVVAEIEEDYPDGSREIEDCDGVVDTTMTATTTAMMTNLTKASPRQNPYDELSQANQEPAPESRLERLASHLETGLVRCQVPTSRIKNITYPFRLLLEVQEPTRTGTLATISMSLQFTLTSFFVVILNAVYIVILTNNNIWESLVSMEETGEPAHHADHVSIEVVFAIFYVGELILKLAVHRHYFFVNKDGLFNCMDMFLGVLAAVESITKLTSSEAKGGGAPNLTFLRLLRSLKLSKVFRVFRGMSFFQEIRLKMELLISSFFQVFWWLIVITFILFLFGLTFVQGLTDYANDPESRIPDKFGKIPADDIIMNFGSVQRAMIALFQAQTGGQDWAEQYFTVAHAGLGYCIGYLFFVSFFMIAILNVVNAAFVEKAIQLAKPDVEGQIMEKHKQDAVHGREMTAMMKKLVDLDGDGMLTVEEFAACLEIKELKEFFEINDIDIKDAHSFFNMLRQRGQVNNKMSVKTFVSAALRLQGHATSVDLQTLDFQVKQLHKYVINHLQRIENSLQSRPMGSAPSLQGPRGYFPV